MVCMVSFLAGRKLPSSHDMEPNDLEVAASAYSPKTWLDVKYPPNGRYAIFPDLIKGKVIFNPDRREVVVTLPSGQHRDDDG